MLRKSHQPKVLYSLGLVCLILTFVLRFGFRNYGAADFSVGMSLPLLLAALVLMKKQKEAGI